MQNSGLRTAPGAAADANKEHDVIAISTLDVLLPKAMVKLWIEMVVHATESMQDITGETNILAREQVRIEEDGSLIFELRMPMNYGEVRMKVPVGKWTYSKPVS